MLKNKEDNIVANKLISQLCGAHKVSENEAVATLVYKDNYVISEANDTFMELTGYTREELLKLFSNNISDILLLENETDNNKELLKIMKESSTDLLDNNFKIRHKSGKFISVNAFFNFFTDKSGTESIYLVLTELSEKENVMARIKEEQEFNTIINNITDESHFYFDYETQRLRFSSNFSRVYGVCEVSYGYPEFLVKNNIISDKELYREFVPNSITKTSLTQKEVTLESHDNKVRTYKLFYQIIVNEDGTPKRLLGRLNDITKQQNEIVMLTNKMERDSLTNIYNKGAIETKTNEYLSKSNPNKDQHAFIIIDVDNFKSVNDRIGHLFGDIVLTQLAEKLTSIFRKVDIIGRLGGDEFYVFVENYSTLDVVYKKAKQICKSFNRTFNEGGESVTISASVGIALYPRHGTTFKELYKNSDTALYTAKSMGKNTHVVYNTELKADYVSTRTQVDSDINKQKNFREHRLEYFFKLLYSNNNSTNAIQSVLQLIAQDFNFSRGYIFETTKDGLYTSNTYEWCEEGINPEIHNLQKVDIADVSTANKHFMENGMFLLKSIYNLPDNERAILEPQGIKSMFQFGIMENGNLIGFIGFDECKGYRIPTDIEIEDLCVLCNLISVFLVKQRHYEENSNRLNYLSKVMNNVDSYVYVVEKDSYKILYENSNLEQKTGTSNLGKLCYETYMNKKSPCKFCLMNSESRSMYLRNQFLNFTAKISAAYIGNFNDSDSYMFTCADITDILDNSINIIED